MTHILGAHMSIAKGFVEAAIKTNEGYKSNAMQIFTKNPRGRSAKPLDLKEAKRFQKYCKENNIVFVVAHGSYLLNFAKPLPQTHWSILDLVDDIGRITALGGVGIVLHTGKHLERQYSSALNELVKNIKVVLKKTEKYKKTKIIIENTAGQGTEMGTSFEQLKELYGKLKKHKRIGFCIDTCHTFAAGYDWNKGVEKIFKKWDRLIGINKISCIHFNDSLKEVGSRVDRHQNIGKGFIGVPALKKIALFAAVHNIPLLLETPEKTLTHADDLKVVKRWFAEA